MARSALAFQALAGLLRGLGKFKSEERGRQLEEERFRADLMDRAIKNRYMTNLMEQRPDPYLSPYEAKTAGLDPTQRIARSSLPLLRKLSPQDRKNYIGSLKTFQKSYLDKLDSLETKKAEGKVDYEEDYIKLKNEYKRRLKEIDNLITNQNLGLQTSDIFIKEPEEDISAEDIPVVPTFNPMEKLLGLFK